MHLLRLATQAPDGTAWARELKAFGRDVEAGTRGQVKIRWIFGGIAGDELQVQDRIRREQLDGVGSGGVLCTQLAPSMRVLRVLGLLQTREEARHLVAKLKPTIDAEFAKSGFTNLGESGLGPIVIFSRQPVRSMEELRKQRFFVWDIDQLFRQQLGPLGIQIVPGPIDQAGRVYDQGRVDGFLTIPVAALAFQWSTQAKYVADLRFGYYTACLLMANRVMDGLPLDDQEMIRTAAAKLTARLEDVGSSQDAALMGGLFAKQGMKVEPVSDTFRAEFFEAARAARQRATDEVVPSALLDRVRAILADYRAEHR